MFSSLSNLLPQVLHSSSPQKTEQIAHDEDDDDDPGSKSDAHADETGVLKKKKDKTANEVNIQLLGDPDFFCWCCVRRYCGSIARSVLAAMSRTSCMSSAMAD